MTEYARKGECEGKQKRGQNEHKLYGQKGEVCDKRAKYMANFVAAEKKKTNEPFCKNPKGPFQFVVPVLREIRSQTGERLMSHAVKSLEDCDLIEGAMCKYLFPLYGATRNVDD